MTVAVILCILASLLWGITNHVDKFMINEIDDFYFCYRYFINTTLVST